MPLSLAMIWCGRGGREKRKRSVRKERRGEECAPCTPIRFCNTAKKNTERHANAAQIAPTRAQSCTGEADSPPHGRSAKRRRRSRLCQGRFRWMAWFKRLWSRRSGHAVVDGLSGDPSERGFRLRRASEHWFICVSCPAAWQLEEGLTAQLLRFRLAWPTWLPTYGRSSASCHASPRWTCPAFPSRDLVRPPWTHHPPTTPSFRPLRASEASCASWSKAGCRPRASGSCRRTPTSTWRLAAGLSATRRCPALPL